MTSRRRRGFLRGGAVAAFAALVLLPALGTMEVSREQELRVALTARRMAGGGSWLVPEYAGRARLQKPPLLYWVVATAFRAAGTVRSAAVARLPTALFGVGLCVAIGLGGRGLVGRRPAFAAALAAASSYLLLRYARLAETDVPMAFFVTLASLGLWRALQRPPAFGRWAAAGAWAGLGFLTKGLGALLPFVTVAAHAAAHGPSRRRLRPAAVLLALLCFAAVAAPWYAAILRAPATGGAARETVSAELGTLLSRQRHGQPLVFYVYTLLPVLLPAGLFLPCALARLARRARRHARDRFLAAWWLGTFVLLTALPSKQMHYTLLLLPPSALAIGAYLRPVFAGRLPRGSFIPAGAAILCGALTLAGLSLAVLPAFTADVDPAAGLAAGLAVAAPAAAGLLWRRGPRARARALAVLAAAPGLLWAAERVLYPLDDGKSVVPAFFARARPMLDAAPNAASVGRMRPMLSFHAGRDLGEPHDWASAVRDARPGDAILVYADRYGDVAMEGAAWAPALEMRRKDVRLALYLAPPPAER